MERRILEQNEVLGGRGEGERERERKSRRGEVRFCTRNDAKQKLEIKGRENLHFGEGDIAECRRVGAGNDAESEGKE